MLGKYGVNTVLTRNGNGEYVIIGSSSTIKVAQSLLRKYLESLVAFHVFLPPEVQAFIRSEEAKDPAVNTLKTLRKIINLPGHFFPGSSVTEVKEKKRVFDFDSVHVQIKNIRPRADNSKYRRHFVSPFNSQFEVVMECKTPFSYLSKSAQANRLILLSPSQWKQIELGKNDPAVRFAVGDGLYAYDDPSVQCGADPRFRAEVEGALEGTHLHVMAHNARLEAFFREKREEGRRTHVIALNDELPENDPNSAIMAMFVDYFGMAEKLQNCDCLNLIIPNLFASLPLRLQKTYFSLAVCALLDASRKLVAANRFVSVHFLAANEDQFQMLVQLFDAWSTATQVVVQRRRVYA